MEFSGAAAELLYCDELETADAALAAATAASREALLSEFTALRIASELEISLRSAGRCSSVSFLGACLFF